MMEFEIVLAFSGKPSKRRWCRALHTGEAWRRAYEMAHYLGASDVTVERI